MESVKVVQALEELQVPLIIVVKDDPGSNKSSTNAHKLASFLKIPFIDQNDITKAILKSITTQDPNNIAENLPFEVVCQIVSTQLSLKIKVVINLPLFDGTHLERLVEVANSEEAYLIIIECNTSEQMEKDDSGLKFIKLNINKASFDHVEKVVSDMSIMLFNAIKDEALQQSSLRDRKKTRQPENDHLHALILSEEPRKDELVCKSCSTSLSGPSYQCEHCDGFCLHKFCAESAPNIKALSQNPPHFLIGKNLNHYEFGTTYKCSNCEEFLYECYDCLLQTHLNNGFLPTILNHKKHPHPLNFIIMPLKFNYKYKCCICDKLGSLVSYKCLECYDSGYDVHVDCILPCMVKTERDQLISFFLTSSDKAKHYHHCDSCNGEINEGQLFYRCEEGPAGLDIHFKCMPDNETDFDSLIMIKKEKTEADRSKMKETRVQHPEDSDSEPEAYPMFDRPSKLPPERSRIKKMLFKKILAAQITKSANKKNVITVTNQETN